MTKHDLLVAASTITVGQRLATVWAQSKALQSKAAHPATTADA